MRRLPTLKRDDYSGRIIIRIVKQEIDYSHLYFNAYTDFGNLTSGSKEVSIAIKYLKFIHHINALLPQTAWSSHWLNLELM